MEVVMPVNRSRRDLIGAGAKLLAAAAIAPANAQLANAQTGPLRVTHFGGPYAVLKDVIAAPFQEAGLGKIDYQVETSVSALTKLQAAQARPPFDVLMLARPVAIRGATGGLFTELHLGALSQAKEIDKGAVMPGNAGMAFIFDSIDIMSRAEIKPPIASWKDLVRDDLKGRLALPAANLSMVQYVLAGLARALGSNETDAKAIDEAFAMMRSIKQNVRVFFTDPVQANQLIERDDISVAPQFGLRIANLAKSNPQVVRPKLKEGVPASPYDLCIAKHSPNMSLADKYIDFVISKGVQESLVRNLLVTPVRADIIVPEDLRKFSLTSADLFFTDEVYLAARQRDWFERWKREIQT
jgi:putative spermidine/putrescine transport system substrate-binding protein